jgi:hypothetical protein
MLPHTLEVESYLISRGAKSGDLEPFLQMLECFVEAPSLGGWRLHVSEKPDAVDSPCTACKPSLEAFAKALPFATGFDFVGSKTVSLMELRTAKREAQRDIYRVAEEGSLHLLIQQNEALNVLRSRLPPKTVTYQGGKRKITLERCLKTCFNASGLMTVLRDRFGAAFAKVFEKDLISVWYHVLGFAAVADAGRAAQLSPLVIEMRRMVPIGRLSAPPHTGLFFVE